MQERDGTESFIDYDQLTNIIDIPELPVQPRKFGEFDVQNIGKSRNVNTLKIQMGFACNYSCSYCLQATAALSPEVNVLDDTHTFLRKLDNWLIGSPSRIEFWGGEPLVYWSRLKILVPTLRDKFPDAEFVMITNGSLLNKERNDFIIKYNIGIGLSHDGEAHTKIRGKDPLTDPTTFKWINDLVTRHNDMLSFNCVLSKGNTNFGDIETYIKSFFDVDIHVGLEGVVST